MSARTDIAVKTFGLGYNCSQAIVTAFAGDFAVPREAGLGVAAGFGGGMGRTGNTCGAVAGAIMVLGLKYGAVEGADSVSKDRCYAKVREFLAAFEKLTGSLICRDLVGFDISNPEERRKAHDAGIFSVVCTKAIRTAVEILEPMIA